MVGFAIARGEFFTGVDVPQGVKSHPALLHLQHHIGLAGVVGKAQRVGGGGGVDRALVGNRHHEDAAGGVLGQTRPATGFGQVDELAE